MNAYSLLVVGFETLSGRWVQQPKVHAMTETAGHGAENERAETTPWFAPASLQGFDVLGGLLHEPELLQALNEYNLQVDVLSFPPEG